MKRNLEIKARLPDRSRARAAAVALGAAVIGVEAQRDTFFACARGRLKLREIGGAAAATLIAYRRGDETDARASDYTLVEVMDPAALIEALGGALGVRGAVVKEREILRWRNVRIHLDAVVGLGDFLELEAVVGEGEAEDEAASARHLEIVRGALAIDPRDLVGRAYADLLGL
ncbi:MAG: class IV adenylate cyclase [Nannocystaceae bacterium]